jgi:hypothetical protein
MRRFLVFIAFACCMGHAAKASDYKYLVLQKTDGTTVSLRATGLTFTFADGYLVASDNTVVELKSLQKMFFSNDELTAIEALVADPSVSGDVEIYTTAGALVGRYGSVERARQALSQGVYLMKNGEKTIKIAVK